MKRIEEKWYFDLTPFIPFTCFASVSFFFLIPTNANTQIKGRADGSDRRSSD